MVIYCGLIGAILIFLNWVKIEQVNPGVNQESISPGNFALDFLLNHRDWRPDESGNFVELTESFHIY